MLNYYLGLAVRSLRRNVALTSLIVIAIGVGIAASTVALSAFRSYTADPIPEKSSQLFVPKIDSLGPESRARNDQPPLHLTYQDARALLAQHLAAHQAPMYFTGSTLAPPNPQLHPFQVLVRATGADFFALFDVPFEYGGAVVVACLLLRRGEGERPAEPDPKEGTRRTVDALTGLS